MTCSSRLAIAAAAFLVAAPARGRNDSDAVTLEAWVKVTELKPGSYAYIVGKGRSRRAGFPEENQNYALRLLGDRGQAKVSFLFASAAETDKPAEWHRWTTTTGFDLGDG